MSTPIRPVMVYDGECGFCRRWIERWRRATGDRVEYATYQDAAAQFPDIPREQFARAVHLIEPDGQYSRGAEAVFRTLAIGACRRWPLWWYQHVPFAAAVSEACYGLVARHRGVADRITTWLWGAHVVPPGEARTVALFLRVMGVVYATAFISLWVQIIGLVGAHGVLPAHEFLEAVASRFGPIRYWYLPTVLWLNASDAALHIVCGAGLACSLLAVVGLAPAWVLTGAWLAYLSLLDVGQVFLHFQWDSLLLETGFVAVVLAPWSRRLRPAPPSRAALWLARWLLFRLMFTSAAVKLTSGDPSWRSLTALDYHYFTQPLPPWTAWYAQHWPAWFQKLSVVVMFAVEGVAPFLVFGPRRARFVAAGAIAGLQLLILATGNYGFFNLLALALCVPLLDDGVWSNAGEAPEPVERRAPSRIARWPRRVVATALVLASLVPLAGALHVRSGGLRPFVALYRALAPLQVVNPYGLFAVMTTDRPEIVIEGSRDGREWKAYEFRYKPGDLARRPALITPHIPRLDWQMWFAALGDVRQNRWFLLLCWRLLEGSPETTALLVRNPFPDPPPRYLRAQVYVYEFTTADERRKSGDWWKRTLRGPYVRNLMLQNGELAPAPVEAVPDTTR